LKKIIGLMAAVLAFAGLTAASAQAAVAQPVSAVVHVQRTQATPDNVTGHVCDDYDYCWNDPGSGNLMVVKGSTAATYVSVWHKTWAGHDVNAWELVGSSDPPQCVTLISPSPGYFDLAACNGRDYQEFAEIGTVMYSEGASGNTPNVFVCAAGSTASIVETASGASPGTGSKTCNWTE
jgi:hypothetical protein